MLTSQRKMELAAGLLKIILATYTLKSVLLTREMILEAPLKGLLISLALLVVAVIVYLLANWCKTRPGLARWGILVPVFVFGWEMSLLRQLFSLNVWIAGLACIHFILLLVVLALLWSNPDSRFSKWARAHPWRLRFIRFGMTFFLLFGIAEMGLRGFDFRPGMLFRQVFFHEVNELKVRGDYATDEKGIFAWSPQAVSFLNGKISENPVEMDRAAVDGVTFFTDYQLYRDYVDLHRGNVDNPYWRMIQSIGALPDSSRTPVEAAYYHQAFHPLNENGFRSIPFRPYATTRKKILLIGDSFTWGHSADNFTSGFADRLAAAGYVVYNAGISGTDPAQYQAIAETYIPALQPDAVVVNFFMGNDIVHFQRPIEPHKDLFYHTNAGNLMAYPGPERLPTAEAAYAFVQDEMRLPVTGPLSRICAWSSVTTLAWRLLVRWNILDRSPPNQAYWDRCAAKIRDKPVSDMHLKAIRQRCIAHQAKFILAVIPEADALGERIPEDFPGLFQGLKVAVPTLKASDYTARDAHFNDQGHIKYTNFLRTELQKALGETPR